MIGNLHGSGVAGYSAVVHRGGVLLTSCYCTLLYTLIMSIIIVLYSITSFFLNVVLLAGILSGILPEARGIVRLCVLVCMEAELLTAAVCGASGHPTFYCTRCKPSIVKPVHILTATIFSIVLLHPFNLLFLPDHTLPFILFRSSVQQIVAAATM